MEFEGPDPNTPPERWPTEWLPMDEAKRDGTEVWLLLRIDALREPSSNLEVKVPRPRPDYRPGRWVDSLGWCVIEPDGPRWNINKGIQTTGWCARPVEPLAWAPMWPF